jgi:hypothetical protein
MKIHDSSEDEAIAFDLMTYGSALVRGWWGWAGRQLEAEPLESIKKDEHL